MTRMNKEYLLFNCSAEGPFYMNLFSKMDTKTFLTNQVQGRHEGQTY